MKHTTFFPRRLAPALMAGVLLWLTTSPARSQVTYETFVYTSDALSSEIQALSADRASERGGYMGSLADAWKGAAKGIASGYVTSFIDLGFNAIGALVTRPSRLKQEWEDAGKAKQI